MSGDPKLPHFHLNHPRNGGGAEQRLVSVERRLRRLHRFTKHDPVELLDKDDDGETLRQVIQDSSRVASMQTIVSRFEERYGDREWLRYGQPIMLEGDSAAFTVEAPVHSDRWIMLLDPEYPEGGRGPVPVDIGVCVYSHAHRGLLAAVDPDDPENHARLFWYFGSEVDVGAQDCVSAIDGMVSFQLYAHHGPALQLGDDGQLGIATGSIYVAEVWPKLAVAVKRKVASLARSGRYRYAPTVDLTP